MKRLQSEGKCSTHKQAEPLSLDEEELMWEKVDIVHYRGLWYAWMDYVVVTSTGIQGAILRQAYSEQKNPGGLKGRNIKPKVADRPDRVLSIPSAHNNHPMEHFISNL